MPFRPLYCSMLALALVCAAPSGNAASKKKKTGAETTQERFQRGSAESLTESERRQLRECKGRPNAGACAGYTR